MTLRLATQTLFGLALYLFITAPVHAQGMDAPLPEPVVESSPSAPLPEPVEAEDGERVKELAAIGLKVVLPENWYLSEKTDDEPSTSFLLASEAEGEEQALFFVSATPKGGRTMEYMTTTAYHYVYTKMEGFVEVEEDVKALGKPAYLLIYEGNSRLKSEGRRKFYRVVLEHKDMIFVFQGVCSAKYFQRYKGTFYEIVETAFWMKDN